MANTTPATPSPSPQRAARGKRWISDRQLDAYFQTKETLRRLRAAAGFSAIPPRPSPPDPTA